MQIIDKASWQIDGGIEPSLVVAHFKRIFSWLQSKDMLTDEGKELLQFGIGDSISLHERLITAEALRFLSARYDAYINSNPYGSDRDSSALESVYASYCESP